MHAIFLRNPPADVGGEGGGGGGGSRTHAPFCVRVLHRKESILCNPGGLRARACVHSLGWDEAVHYPPPSLIPLRECTQRNEKLMCFVSRFMVTTARAGGGDNGAWDRGRADYPSESMGRVAVVVRRGARVGAAGDRLPRNPSAGALPPQPQGTAVVAPCLCSTAICVWYFRVVVSWSWSVGVQLQYRRRVSCVVWGRRVVSYFALFYSIRE